MKRRKFVKKLGLVALTGTVLRPYAIKSAIPDLKKEREINKTNVYSPRVIKTFFQTDDVVIASYNVMDFGAKGDGKTNDAEAIQAALNQAGENGGGVVFIPAGSYALHNRLIIRAGTTLRGDWKNPFDTTFNNKNENGTVLMAFADKGKSEGAAFIDILDNAGIKNLTIWYPEQQMDTIEAYPFTIRQVEKYNATIENVTLVNSYQGIEIGPGNNSLAMIRNVYATALKTGL
ncbi:MAG: glycosyl hydrolase family 28-related protein, partial [Parabacteroides sp.]|nr:glycosyl hydrolase family 28-related protein [Parabacteroides sp.]